MRADAHDVAVSCSIGVDFGHQVERSVNVNKYRKQFDDGRGHTISGDLRKEHGRWQALL